MTAPSRGSTSMCSHKTTKFWPRQSALGSTRALQVTSGSCYLRVKKSSEVVKVGARLHYVTCAVNGFPSVYNLLKVPAVLETIDTANKSLCRKKKKRKEVHSTLSRRRERKKYSGLCARFSRGSVKKARVAIIATAVSPYDDGY